MKLSLCGSTGGFGCGIWIGLLLEIKSMLFRDCTANIVKSSSNWEEAGMVLDVKPIGNQIDPF